MASVLRPLLWPLMILSWAIAGVACTSGDTPDDAAGTGSAGSGGAAAKWIDYQRDDDYPNTVRLPAEYIPMSDGVLLSAQVMLPADADGNAVEGPLPVVLTQTGYNKSASGYVDGFAFNSDLVRHGYAHVAVDVRGTGTSGGTWEIFSEREQLDYKEVMDWVAAQPWSNGKVGTWGPSFMGITQIFTGAWRHPAHKAIFALVPMGDAYRDIVFTGGQVNAGFIPLWLGLVTGLGLVPAQPSPEAVPALIDHLLGTLTYDVPVILQAILGSGGQNYDSAFWRTRSPIEVADRIRVPTFIVGGLHDIFQRGEPMLYEVIKKNTTAKLLIGPWTHVDASFGAGLPADGVPSTNQIALMWFDRYLRGMDNGAESVPNVTQYVFGEERYVVSPDWPHPQARAERWYLHGDHSLSAEPPGADEPSRYTLQIPVQGLCSVSSAQWTAGVLGLVPLPCFDGANNINELPLLGAVTYTTPPMDEDYYVNGPIQADLWVSRALATDASVAVRITDVDPDGGSTELTNGTLTVSLRAVDAGRSRMLSGDMIQPWHPFTEDVKAPFAPGESTLVNIEVFPSSFVIKAGHSLRIAVGSSDFPHGLPPVTDLLDQVLGVLRIDSNAEHPSSFVVPVVPVSALN